jgi:hypothetical protein
VGSGFCHSERLLTPATFLRALSPAPAFSVRRINHKESCNAKPAELVREGWAACSPYQVSIGLYFCFCDTQFAEVADEVKGTTFKHRIAEVHATSMKRLSKIEAADDPSDGAGDE